MRRYRNEILRLIPKVDRELRLKQAAEAARQAQAEHRTRAEQIAQEKYERLGSEVVSLLLDHAVPSLPAFYLDKKTQIVEVGQGWHVYTLRYGDGESPPRICHTGVVDTGEIVNFTDKLYVGDERRGEPKGVEYRGIIVDIIGDDPTKITSRSGIYAGQEGLDMVTSDFFKRAVASLILTGEPYDPS